MNSNNAVKSNFSFRDRLKSLIEASGGQLDETGLFVTKPGCQILNLTTETKEAEQLYNLFNIDTDRPLYEQRSEFKSRITYLAFRQQKMNSQDYNQKMAQEFQHLSVHSSTQVEFLIAGVSIETCLEFVAHGEARVARLTSSKTKAMDDTLYRIQGTPEEQEIQKRFTLSFLEMKKDFETQYQPRTKSSDGTELTNMLNLGTKANAFTYSMNLKDYHKLFIGRLSEHGNEKEVQEVCRMMCEELCERFPLVIKTPEQYYQMNNGSKYST